MKVFVVIFEALTYKQMHKSYVMQKTGLIISVIVIPKKKAWLALLFRSSTCMTQAIELYSVAFIHYILQPVSRKEGMAGLLPTQSSFRMTTKKNL